MTQMHLAELNIARFAYAPDDPRVAEFMDNLDRVNAVAERSPGFVWRLKDDGGNATDIQAFADHRIIVNMSVWESAETLEKFVWQTIHKRFYGKRASWFEPAREAHLVMWWVPAGHLPTVEEARERLEHLRKNGPSDYAFGWEGLPNVQLWRSQRCA